MGGRSQLLAFRLLVDAAWQPAAVQLSLRTADEGRLAALLGGPEMASLTAVVPCVATEEAASRSPALAAACRILPASAILSVTAAKPEPLPDGVDYLWFAAVPLPAGRLASPPTGSRALALRLAQLVSTDADTREIEEVFRLDPTLSYHLLRLVNSAGVGVGRVITSFAQAILILGRTQLRRWLNLLLFAACKDDPRAPLLMARASLRARQLELLAKAAGADREGQEQAFMAGMFSLLGDMFGMPLADILKPLRLEPRLAEALLKRTGELGCLLAAVVADEAGEDAEGAPAGASLAALAPEGADPDALTIEGYAWMLSLVRGMQAAP